MGHMKDLDRRIRAGGDDAIAAVQEYFGLQTKILEDIAKALAEPRWIPVGERLPEDGQSVLVVFDGAGITGSVGETTFARSGAVPNGWFSTDRGCWGGTHWMPLPEPPEVTK